MARFGSLDTQYFDDAGNPLVDGKVYFFDTGTTTPKPTFADAELTIANTHPVILTAAGRQPNVFFDGVAKAILTTSAGVQILVRDPVGDDSSSTNGFPAWVDDQIYDLNEPVTASNNYIYTSLTFGNIANDPISSPANWQLLAKTIGFDDANNGYVYVVDTAQPLKINAVPKSTINTLVPLASARLTTPSAVVDFIGLTSEYEHYQIVISNAIPVNFNSATFSLRTSSDNGSTFDSGASDYRFYINAQTDASQISLSLSAAGGDGLNENGWSGVINFFNRSGETYPQFIWDYMVIDDSSNMETLSGAARRTNATVNALRFFYATSSIRSGTFTLYGVRTS